MLTSTHAIWSHTIFNRFIKSKNEALIIIGASIIPDIEILFWSGMNILDRFLHINPFAINYKELLHGSGISFWYWPLTLITNSILITSLTAIALSFLFKNSRKICFIGWLVVQFHIILDALTHKSGNMIFWPLSIQKYLGMFDFNSFPIFIILAEQIFSFSLLFWLLYHRKQPTGAFAINED